MSSQKDKNTLAFFALLKAGLWEEKARLSCSGGVDFEKICDLSREQSVLGLVAAGFEHVTDVKVQKDIALTLAGEMLQLEQHNSAMDHFIGVLTEKMNVSGIYSLLVKGQGIAQCYERPLWRACGDVDLFLNEENYYKAKEILRQQAKRVEEENPANLHLGMTIDPWVVELHGTLRSELWKAVDYELDAIQDQTFQKHEVRVWKDGETNVLLPSPNNDVIFVFTHILQHFFMGGIGLRQVCDWCRLLYTYKSDIDAPLLESRLKKMGLVSEWKAFAALAVNTLGMPVDAMPLYSPAKKWVRKSNRILALILESGNFGHNRDNSYYQKYPYLVYKAISLWRNTWDSMRHFMIFPLDATKVWWNRLGMGIREVIQLKYSL